MIKQISVIGVGLIGGSLALALKQAGYCQRIVGVGRNIERLQQAMEAGLIDECTNDYKAGVVHADVVFISVPLNAYLDVFEKIRDHLKADTVFTDAGSAKRCVVEDAQKAFGKIPAQFVPGHPIAGAEKSGFTAAQSSLFKKRRIILTPLQDTQPQALRVITEMWQATGAIVEQTDMDHHDQVLAATSHLPHLLAFGLVDSLARGKEVEEIFRFAAGGFRDFTRIAAADPIMWRDICLRNREAILGVMKSYQQHLSELYTAIDSGDEKTLTDIFTSAKSARDKFKQ